ncbi:hypothetical protein FBU31_000447 [Coemansia sp. 'formosensis']|nr:hypothetical protein FBU31_000447 [Coemansia sp. 'formosensis']
MVATTLTLHTLELDHAIDQQILHSDPGNEDYANLLKYFDPDKPAYCHAVSIQQSLVLRERLL